MAAEDDIRKLVERGRARGLTDDQLRAVVARYRQRMAPQSDRVQTAASRATGIGAPQRSGIVDRVLSAEGLPGVAVGAVREGVKMGAQVGDMALAGLNMLLPASMEVERPMQTDTTLQRGLEPRNQWQQAGARGTQVGSIVSGGTTGARTIAAQVPTRAAAGQKFQQVMRAVGDHPVDVAEPGNAALRIYQLSERGASMPKVVRDLLKRATDPEKGDINYQEARDFYSNISRLSADEFQRLNPVVKLEIGKLRVALDRALAKTAASGGQEDVYREAMRQYAIASRMRELAEKAMKYGAAAAGAGAAYSMGSDLLNR